MNHQLTGNALRQWHVIAICCVFAALFAYFGPRRSDDATEAARLAVLSSLRTEATASCNEAAKEGGDKVVFAPGKASYELKLDTQLPAAAVAVRQDGYLCFAPQGADAVIGQDENSN